MELNKVTSCHKATGLQVCLLLNFGQPRVDVKRLVNDYQETPAPDSVAYP